jgi:hypothetical protein
MKEAYAVRRTVPPSAEIQASIDKLLSKGLVDDPQRILSELARLGARLIIQRAVEDEFDQWLGRARYERRPERQRGMRRCPGCGRWQPHCGLRQRRFGEVDAHAAAGAGNEPGPLVSSHGSRKRRSEPSESLCRQRYWQGLPHAGRPDYALCMDTKSEIREY